MTQVQTGSYPIAENCLQLARALINDMLRTTAGSILTDTSPFTNVFLNHAIRNTQRRIANNGLLSNVVDNFILGSVLPVANSDPGTQVSINVNGYFNGAVQLSQPVLPPDLILPLNLFQRQTGSGAQFTPMRPAKKPLQSRIPGAYFGEWEWRQNAINMVGCTVTTDLRLRYEQALPRIGTGVAYSQVTIGIIDGEDAIAAGIVRAYAFSRGSAQRQEAEKFWGEMCDSLVNRYVRFDQRIAVRPNGFRAGGGTIDGAMSGDYR